ncbi:MAG: SDR family oxidoreductase [Burkholderiales bacterium]|nr:SDR family oxidoreductase [Burkholderiales bacterium]
MSQSQAAPLTAPRDVVVVGATSAVAQAAIRHWAHQRARLVLVGRNRDALERVAADARLRGAASVDTQVGDLADTAFIETVCAIASPTIALIAHGSLSDSARSEASAQYLEYELTLNFVSAAQWVQQLALACERAGGGTVVAISSVAGDRGRGSNHVYGAAKAGLSAFCSGLRARMATRGVHIMTVLPGFIDSPMTAHIANKGALWTTPETIAQGIIRAITRQRDVVYLPGFWRLIMLIIKHVPERIFKRLKF